MEVLSAKTAFAQSLERSKGMSHVRESTKSKRRACVWSHPSVRWSNQAACVSEAQPQKGSWTDSRAALTLRPLRPSPAPQVSGHTSALRGRDDRAGGCTGCTLTSASEETCGSKDEEPSRLLKHWQTGTWGWKSFPELVQGRWHFWVWESVNRFAAFSKRACVWRVFRRSYRMPHVVSPTSSSARWSSALRWESCHANVMASWSIARCWLRS